MDPQVKAFLDELKAAQVPGWETMTPDEARQTFDSMGEMFLPQENVGSVKDIPLPNGAAIRIYRPLSADSNALPALVYFHGGGWVLGNVETHDTLCRRLCNQSGLAIASVDYRLAPENPYPAALTDCDAALRYVFDHAQELKVNRERIAVGGDSAGGNLAAAVCLKARDEANGPNVYFQLLVYPVLDDLCDSESYSRFSTDYGLTRGSMKWFWRQYLGKSNGADPLAAPMRAGDLSGLPPAYLMTAEYDVLRDEGEAFAKRLQDAGVDVELKRYPGLIHGFFHFGGLFDRGREAVDETAAVAKKAMA